MTDVKLSSNTINLLKNFSTINQGIKVKKGSQIRTIAVSKNILAEADVDEHFPQDFAIYDLNEFLALVTLFKEPILRFKDSKSVMITDASGRNKVNYFFAGEAVVVGPPSDKKLSLPSEDVNFTLSKDSLLQVMKAAGILGHKFIVVRGKRGQEVSLVATDIKDNTANEFSMAIEGATAEADFDLIFDVENLKMVPDDYEVTLCANPFYARFASKAAGDLQYWIALNKDSTFSKTSAEAA